ncbi:hypothetical protein L226DRAFT_612942 [Lentinus tigrinus ALCF2SS1-7]|uniref:Alpha-ketoglutarate-dependent dioxygenase AlkB-like domain-containing protein n=1 Tax=Lentinus tigrinus ALCF2SS1-6 TaxID=1328759 RepID=A0A5C2RW24_9APHY|nr:hypothetical protein L227DRAFT_555847 [Lentinus tigrinus ALCF2SS1-6]RPD75330.1 hypothetical protein L226DRAFT_612942 [Lentinus tigrinus ALCF2SS1-7]
MTTVMRLPASWKDRSLLDDPPFISVFFIHKHCLHNTRTKGKRDDWLKRLAEDIRNAPDTRAAAVRWAELAFQPDSDRVHSEVVAHDHTSLDTALVFVNFYWSWFCNGASSAQKVVDTERKRRGFQYRLPDILQKSPETRVADVDAPLTPLTDASTELGNVQDVHEPIDALPLEAAVLHAADIDEEYKDDMVVFADQRDVDVFMESCLSPLSDISSLASLPDESTSEVPDPGEAHLRSPTAVEAASYPASGLTLNTTVEEDEQHTEYAGAPLADDPLMSHHGKSNSRSKVGGNSKLRQVRNGAREAANETSQQTVADEDTGGRAKRGSAAAVEQGNRKKRSKTDKADRPCAPSTNPITPTPQGQHSTPTSLTHYQLQKSPPNLISLTAASEHPPQPGRPPTAPTNQRKTRKRRPKMPQADARGKGRPRKVNTDADERPAKRQRGKDGYDPTQKFNTADVPQRDSPRPTMQLSVFHHHEGQLTREGSFFAGSPAPSDGETSSGAAASRKRPRDVEGVSDVDRCAVESKVHRAVVMLRKPTLVRRPLPRSPAPWPSLGLPRDLPEADRMLRDGATDALVTLTSTVSPAEVWTARDPCAEDEYPPSDDEEDVPLREVISAGREALSSQSAAAAVEDVAVPEDDEDDYKDPWEWRAASLVTPVPPSRSSVKPTPPPLLSSTTPASVRTSKTRIPKPLPPPQISKRPLTAQPPIWAKSRQEVCESFDWFKSYQGGVYFKDDIARGYLLGGYYASRDLLARDGRLIISHGGGKAESLHSNKGKLKLQEASDQREGDKSVRALLQTFRLKKEIALLIDDRYALFPYDLSARKNCMYVVLGFYHIVHAWAERQPENNAKGFVVRWKFAFEWCEQQPAPWWIQPSDASCIPEPDQPEKPVAPLEAQCSSCKASSRLVYQQGWMCLQPSCKAFWRLSDGTLAPEDLTYDETFLAVAFICEHDPLGDICPQPPAEPDDGVVTGHRFSRGWHCKKCGRLSSRFKWQCWECQNCGATMQATGKNRIAKEFRDQKDPKFVTHNVLDEHIIAYPMRPYRTPDGHFSHYHAYKLPDIQGTIYLVLGNHMVNSIADEIFEEYQEQAKTGELQFRRFPLKAHQCRGEFLTNYFSQNSGEPYQYVGGTGNTVPFDAAPSAVVKARDLIQSRMMSIMQAERQPYQFNEVLSAAYMEKQSMSFHSDAEPGLGPRVASLSLGSCAHMHFRRHRKYRTDGGTGNAPKSLTLFLRHGDVLIMDGADIQEYYEHTVVPLNFRIAATARYISKNHL